MADKSPIVSLRWAADRDRDWAAAQRKEAATLRAKADAMEAEADEAEQYARECDAAIERLSSRANVSFACSNQKCGLLVEDIQNRHDLRQPYPSE